MLVHAAHVVSSVETPAAVRDSAFAKISPHAGSLRHSISLPDGYSQQKKVGKILQI
jgi:hypothetical protein